MRMMRIAKTTFRASVSVDEIFPSPENDELYGAIDESDNDLINLANDIVRNGVREPLQVSADGYIVSGHRRHAAARLTGLTHIPIVRLKLWRSKHDPLEWKRILRAHNHQRLKPAIVRLKEAMLDIDPDLAHQQLVSQRDERDRDAPPRFEITGEKVRCTFSDRKREMLDAAIKVATELKNFWPVSDRQIHYGLLNDPPFRNTSAGKQRSRYANDKRSYQDLCGVLTRARLFGLIPWEAIADETRPVTGTRYNKDAATFVDLETHHFLRGYRRDLMQSQADHVELIVEKLTVQGIIDPIARQFCIPTTVGRGYCSINPRYEIVQRYRQSGKDRLVLLIAGDFDADGEEIAESFARSIRDDFGVDEVVASKILLRQDQVRSWKLPKNSMEAKKTSSKFAKFVKKYGNSEVYELEAISPAQMQATVREAIESTIDLSAFNTELAAESQDAVRLQGIKTSVADSFLNMVQNADAE